MARSHGHACPLLIRRVVRLTANARCSFETRECRSPRTRIDPHTVYGGLRLSDSWCRRVVRTGNWQFCLSLLHHLSETLDIGDVASGNAIALAVSTTARRTERHRSLAAEPADRYKSHLIAHVVHG
jgi:hypothetical protein